MKSLEDIAVQTYKNNLTYFEKHQPQIYSKLAAFDSAIEQNHYQNKYDLILKDDYFDVLELSSGNYLYTTSSREYAQNAAKSIDYKQDTNAFETFKHVKIKDEELEIFEAFDIEYNNLSGFAPILHYIDKNSPKEIALEEIKKFIFFGVGLGTHIESIDKKIGADVYLIVEDDLELFKLSLFVTSYYDLASRSKLMFSVFDTQQEFSKISTSFLETDFYYNHYIKYFNMLSHSEEKLKEFHIKVTSQSHNIFFYSEILKQFTRPLDYLKNNFNFANIIRLNAKPAFGQKPVLLLAAGPSLQKNMTWIKENQERFIIIAVSATLSILEKNKIIPDIVTHVDGTKGASIHFEKLDSLDFFKETIFLLSARTLREVVDKLDKNNVFFFEKNTSYKKDFGSISAPCVGSTSYILSIIFGIKKLFLLGLDLALDSKTGSTHSDGHEYTKKLDLDDLQQNDTGLSYKNSIIKTDGNFQKEVFTTPEYFFSIDSINTSTQGYKSKTQIVYNLSDGALFTDTIPTRTADVDLDSLAIMDKLSIKKELHDIFIANSSNKMTKDELKFLRDKRAYSIQVKNIILAQERSIFSSYDDFLNSLKEIFKKLSLSSSSIEDDLSLVYKEYSRFIYTFIFNFFNTKDLEEKTTHANQLNKLLCKQLLRIVSSYEREL